MWDTRQHLNERIWKLQRKYKVGQRIKMELKPIKTTSKDNARIGNRTLIGRVCALTRHFMVVQFENYRESFVWTDILQMKIK